MAYEYNINSSAPVDPLNPFLSATVLVAYLYDYGAEQTADVPPEAIADAKGLDKDPDVHYHYVLTPDGKVVSKTALDGSTTTYVTFESGDLPLLRPVRSLPGGDILADALEPTLTELVNAGYGDGLGEKGNEAIPLDPRVPRPMQPGSSLGNLGDVPDTFQTGLDAGEKTAQDDLESPTNFVTKPLGEVGKSLSGAARFNFDDKQAQQDRRQPVRPRFEEARQHRVARWRKPRKDVHRQNR